jgi:hypothetical protein
MRNKKVILLAIIVISVAVLLLVGPIAQDVEYLKFIDKRQVFNVSNFYDVFSNIAFLLVGIWGLSKIHWNQIIQPIKVQYIILCVGIILTAFGSAYFHLNPNIKTLFWDRLPMTIVFMSFFSAIIADYISYNIGKNALIPLLLFGLASVIYWIITEEVGRGDLRLYIMVHYIPMILILLILFMYKPTNTQKRFIIWAFVFYGTAKIFETFDSFIFEVSRGLTSGHTIKHVLAALGAFFIIKMFFYNPKFKIQNCT